MFTFTGSHVGQSLFFGAALAARAVRTALRRVRTLRSLCAAASLAMAASAFAQQGAGDLLLGVSEGTSGGLDHARVVAKYSGLADAIGRAAKRKVKVVFAREFALLEEGIRTDRFDLVLARPSDYPARAMRDHGYQFIASARPEGHCLIIVGKDSRFEALDQAKDKGVRWVLPEQAAYMSRFCTAELRDRGIHLGSGNVQYIREQAAVPFYLDNKFADAGAVASYSGVAKSLEKTGHRVLHKSGAQPYFPLVASQRMAPDMVRAIQAELAVLPQTESGREVLKTVGIQSFDTGSGERLRALLKWLGE